MTPFIADRRGVSEVVGAVVIFGFLILALSAYQTIGVPAQNTDIEVSHSFDVQDDLAELQSAIVANAERQRTQAVTVDLAPQYPTRILTLNGPPPRGEVTTETVGTGSITSNGFDVNQACRLSAGSANTVPTQSISYFPRYNYFDNGNVPHRIEHTLFYQADPEGGVTFVRSNDSLVDPASRTVSLSPIQGQLQADGTRVATVRLIRGYERTVSATDATVTIPTVVSADVWRDQLTAGSAEVTVANVSPTAVEITFTGQWNFQCAPVGVNGAPEQLPTAAAGTDTRVNEGSTVQLDGSNSKPARTLTDYSWSFVTAPPSGVSFVNSTTQVPIVDASGADVSTQTPVDIQLTVTDTNGNTDTDRVTLTIAPVSNGGTGGTTPSLTGIVENLPTASTPTQNITFSPTGSTIPAGETVAIDLSNANGVTQNGDPNPVNYENININGNFSGSFNTVTGSDTFVVEFTPSTNIGTGRIIGVQLQSTQTQETVTSGVPVVVSRSDGDGFNATFALFDGTGGGNGGNSLQGIAASTTTTGGSGKAAFALENTGESAVTVTGLRIDSTTSSATQVSANGNNPSLISNRTGALFSGTITVGGSQITFDQSEQFGAGETVEIEFDRFDGDVRGEDVVITVFLAGEPSEEFTLSYPN